MSTSRSASSCPSSNGTSRSNAPSRWLAAVSPLAPATHHQTKQGLRYTISETARRKVLARLLKLNHERYAEEVRQGLHEKKGKGTRGKGRGKKAPANNDETGSLFS